MLQIQPIGPGSTKYRVSGSIFLPLRQLMAGGVAYVIPRATTDAETMALKALLEPRKMQPKMTTRTTVRYSALSGTSKRELTFAKTREYGRPPSLAKAYVIRLLVVMIAQVAKSRQISGNIKRQIDPA
jgi:hypothetical protein